MDHRLCACALLGQHREAAETRIAATLPRGAREMTFANFETGNSEKNKQALRAARNFVDLWEDHATQKGWILGFWGLPASGKTHLAMAMTIALIKRYFVTAAVFNVPDMLRLERARWGTKPGTQGTSLIQRAIDADFLVLDDLGSQQQKKSDDGTVTWVEEQLYVILDQRIMNLKPIVYTTNLNPDALKTALSSGEDEWLSRIWSRIERAQVTDPYEVKPVPGKNRRPDSDALLLSR